MFYQWDFAFLLRYTAQNGEDLAAPVIFLELIQAMKNLLFGFVPDTTGVVENELGLVRCLHLSVATSNESANDFFRVVGVHLATERLA